MNHECCIYEKEYLFLYSKLRIVIMRVKTGSFDKLDVQTLLKVGGNSSFFNGIMLFDNLDENESAPLSRFPTGIKDNPVKLNSNIVVMCIYGCLDYSIDCREKLSVYAGEVAIFSYGQIAQFIKSNPGTKVMMIATASDINTSMSEVADTCLRYGCSSIPTDEINNLTILDLYRMMKRTMNHPDIKYQERVLSNCLDVLCLTLKDTIIRNRIDNPETGIFRKADRQVEIYQAFVRLVKSQFRHHRDVGYYADAVCLSTGHLSRIVKIISGKTASEWIKEYVLLEAKAMLKTSGDAVYQISDTLNFPNVSFFCKFFKEKTGMTPNQYREV